MALCGLANVRRCARILGVAVSCGIQGRKLSDAQRDVIRAAHAAGYSCAQIASLYGVSKNAIWATVNREARKAASARYRVKHRAAREAYAKARVAECRAAQARWYTRNRDAARAKAEAWKQAHPEACAAMQHRRRAHGYVDAETIASTLQMADGVCAYCLQRARLTIDHVLPVSRNGRNCTENLVAACNRCNAGKRNRTPLEFICKLPRLG